MFISFGPWRPDLSDVDSGATEATNVIPGVNCYEPQKSLQVYTGQLVTRCQGAIMAIDQFGAVYWFAGDRNHLYLINVITNTWSDVSRPVFRAAPPTPDGALVSASFGNTGIAVPKGYANSFALSQVPVSVSGTIFAAITTPATSQERFGSPPVIVAHSLNVSFAISTLSTPPPVVGYQPADPDLIPAGKAVLNYMSTLVSRSDKRFLSGQYHLDHCQTIFNETGKWPAVCSELVAAGAYSTSPPWPRDLGASVRGNLKTYWDAGGIPSFHGIYSNPKTHGPQSDSNFTASDMVSVVTENGNAINADFRLLMDNAIAHLLWLQSYGVPVFYRPFMEQVQGGFWYGTRDSDINAAATRYKNLWKYHFNYFMSKGVHNVIWVYAGSTFVGSGHPAGMSGTFYPGNAWVDIAGCDMYKDLPGTTAWTSGDVVESIAVRNASPGRIQAFPEYGQQAAASPGLHTDYRKILALVKNLFPQAAYWMSWSSVWSMRAADNAFVPQTLADSWVVNRGDLPSFTGITPQEPIQAFYMTSFGANETVGQPALSRLDALPLGTTHAIITLHLQTPSATSNTVARTTISENPANLAAWFAAVRARGIEPAMAIILSITPFDWAGMWNPSTPATALANYYTAVRPWVQAAQTGGLPFVILCDEWATLFTKSAAVTAFQTLFNSARADYGGQLSINMSHLSEQDTLPGIVSLTDFVGVNAYLPIATTDSPSVDTMVSNFIGPSQVPAVQAVIGSTPYMTYIKNLLSTWNKQCIFTTGYKSTVGAGRDPSEQPETTVDELIQRDCWRAFKIAASTVPNLGLACWRWWPGTAYDDARTGFTPQGKILADEIWTQDLSRNPYTSTSVHHRPIGTGATYAADNNPAVVDLLKSNFTTVNVGLPNGCYYIANTADMQSQTVTVHPGGSGTNLPVTLKMPTFTADGPVGGNYYDNIVIIYNAAGDGRVYIFYEFVWLAGQSPQAYYVLSHDITGKGHGATRTAPGASGISLLVGLTRGYEINTDEGEIHHCAQLLAMTQTTASVMKNAFQWPSVGTDSFCDGVTSCVGNIPYGSLWALPRTTYTDAYIANNMGLSVLGQKIARQMRDYGGYFIDGANGRPSRGDQTILEARRLLYNAQMQLIYPHLRMVTNNLESQTVSGGGSAIAINSAYDA